MATPSLWISLAAVVAAFVIGIPLSIWATADVRKNKKAYAVASALLLAFGIFNPIEEKIADAREDTDHAERQKAPGDPP